MTGELDAAKMRHKEPHECPREGPWSACDFNRFAPSTERWQDPRTFIPREGYEPTGDSRPTHDPSTHDCRGGVPGDRFDFTGDSRPARGPNFDPYAHREGEPVNLYRRIRFAIVSLFRSRDHSSPERPRKDGTYGWPR